MEQKFIHISLTKIMQGVNKKLVQFKKLGYGFQKKSHNFWFLPLEINKIFDNIQLIFDIENDFENQNFAIW